MKMQTRSHCFLAVCMAVTVVAAGGWFKKKEEPLLPQGAIMAAYGTQSAKKLPVMKTFEEAFDSKRQAISELIKGLGSNELVRVDENPLEAYFGINQATMEWSLFSVGGLARPTPGEDISLPEMTWVVCGAMEKEKVVATVKRHIAETKPGLTWEAMTVDGEPAWMLKGVALDQIQGLGPCFAFHGKRLLLIASHEKALRKLKSLYQGKSEALPKNETLWQVLQPDPKMISRFMVVHMDELISSVMSEMEMKGPFADPKMDAVVRSLRNMTVELRVVPDETGARLAMSLGCADEANAQLLNELLITAKTSMQLIINMGLQKQPELRSLSDWLAKVRLGVSGEQATLSLECTPADIQNMDITKWVGQTLRRSQRQR